ncbi:MAG: 50S ribosomal protein L10 [Spirochaetia bacterium]|nr:50S ribosomal protein L10 [Spirochaetia bacterium]
MPSAKNVKLEEEYTKNIEESSDFILTRFKGLDVAQITELRQKLREKEISFRVIKNNIFKLAAKKNEIYKDVPLDEMFTGPIGVAFTRDDTPAAAKVLKNFSGEYESFEIHSGVMESKYYDKQGIEEIATLPSRDESLARVASVLNGPARQTASLVNQIISSLARAIKAVGEKNG